MFNKVGYILGHKLCLNNFEITDTLQKMLSA